MSSNEVYRDRVDTFDEYEALGLGEYWIIDPRPEQHRAWFWTLGADGRFHEMLNRT